MILVIGAIAVLLRICWTDFFYLKIYNRDLMVLLAILVAFLTLIRPDDILLRIGLGAILFTVAFVFWLLGKAGAGDAKLLGIAGVFIPPESALLFAVLILVFTIGFYLLGRQAEMLKFLPVMAGRRIMELIETRRVPYGIPIALATIALLAPRIALQ